MSRRTALRHVKTLLSYAILKKTHAGGYSLQTGECLVNAYCIMPDDKWKKDTGIPEFATRPISFPLA